MRVQLNVIGGYLYKDTISSEAKITKEIQTMYNLIVIQHITHIGLQNLIKIVKNNVNKIMEHITLKQEMNQNEIEQLFWSIQSSIDKEINHNYAQFVLPSESQFRNQYDSTILNKMLTDTMDVYECGEFIEIVESIIVNGFSVVTDKISEYFTFKETPENEQEVTNLKKIPIAKLIPIINSLTTQVLSPTFAENQSPENLAASLTSMYIVNTKLQTLGANVYEVYCQ
jgi:peroxin-3